jgi:hypothetical protein
MRHLTIAQIATLDALFLRGHEAIEELRLEAPEGRALHAVKVPHRLTESIVAANCERIFGPGTCVLAGSAPHDLALRRRRRRRNVAVKGSGMTDWAVVTDTDRRADVLVWVNYRDRLLDNAAPVVVWRIPIARLSPGANRAFLGTLTRRCTPIPLWPG